MSKNFKSIIPFFKKKNIYYLKEALNILKLYHFTKFNSTINLIINLKYDKTNNYFFQKNTFLPYSNKRQLHILVLIDKKYRKEIKKLGIKYVGGNKYIKKIENEKWLKFDLIISNKFYMKKLLKLGKILGKYNLIPNYEDGTIIDESNYLNIIKKYIKYKRLLIKNDKYGILHLIVGKINLKNEKIICNILYLINYLKKIKINNKNINIKSIYINTTMSPSLKIDIENEYKKGKKKEVYLYK